MSLEILTPHSLAENITSGQQKMLVIPFAFEAFTNAWKLPRSPDSVGIAVVMKNVREPTLIIMEMATREWKGFLEEAFQSED
jgi:hypothetical protein